MFKAMILLSRRDDMTHDEFVAWWTTEHRPLAAALDGVRRVVFNVVEGDGAAGADGIDGIAELWFDNEQAFVDAYATEHGKAVAADSMAHVRSRTRLFVDELTVMG